MTEVKKQRNERKDIVGIVSSLSGDKTVKVEYQYKIPHPRYGKEIKRKTVFLVHDEKGECKIGDKIEIMETRPLSKTKRFRLVKILENAPVIAS